MGAKKLPFLQLFVDDYLADEKLGLCSLAARGLWMHLLCLMHKSDRRGYLQQANGQPCTTEQIARSAGCSADEAAHLLRELIDSGAASATEHGVIFNRRMVHDERVRLAHSKAGQKGGKATAGLLKQNSSKRPSKTAADSGNGNGIGVLEREGGAGEEETEHDPPSDAARLAQLFAFLCRSTVRNEKDPYLLAAAFAEWLRTGLCTADELQREIENEGRDRSEPSWKLKDRLERRHRDAKPTDRQGPCRGAGTAQTEARGSRFGATAQDRGHSGRDEHIAIKRIVR